MKALVFRGTKQIAVEEVAEAKPQPDEVLIEVAYCGICGSDLHGYLGHSARRSKNVPLVMGHEFSGRVAASGEDVRGQFTPGQRVTVHPQIGCGSCPACRSGRKNLCPNMTIVGIERAGAFAPYVAVPADRVFPLPDTLSDQAATLAETLAVEVHLFRQMVPSLVRSVLVLGAGAQGLLAVQLARLANIPEILVSDVVPARLKLAERLGATAAVNARETDVSALVKERTGGWGVELAVETTGAPPARLQGLAALAPGATFGLVGLGEGPTTVDFLPVVAREYVLRGSYCYTDDDFARSIELLASGQVRGEEMLSVTPLSGGPDAFAELTENPSDKIKVLLQPV
jgi:2-desacetyl-2-hydroxyethyl bacteriochlorophyllide A dehydrogenase